MRSVRFFFVGYSTGITVVFINVTTNSGFVRCSALFTHLSTMQFEAQLYGNISINVCTSTFEMVV